MEDFLNFLAFGAKYFTPKFFFSAFGRGGGGAGWIPHLPTLDPPTHPPPPPPYKSPTAPSHHQWLEEQKNPKSPRPRSNNRRRRSRQPSRSVPDDPEYLEYLELKKKGYRMRRTPTPPRRRETPPKPPTPPPKPQEILELGDEDRPTIDAAGLLAMHHKNPTVKALYQTNIGLTKNLTQGVKAVGSLEKVLKRVADGDKSPEACVVVPGVWRFVGAEWQWPRVAGGGELQVMERATGAIFFLCGIRPFGGVLFSEEAQRGRPDRADAKQRNVGPPTRKACVLIRRAVRHSHCVRRARLWPTGSYFGGECLGRPPHYYPPKPLKLRFCSAVR